MRAEIVLLAASGMTNLAIAQRPGITRITVATRRNRFAHERLDGLVDDPRPGAPRKIDDEKIARLGGDELGDDARRRAAWTPPTPRAEAARGHGRLFQNHVLRADQGCDFDFCRRPDPDETPA